MTLRVDITCWHYVSIDSRNLIKITFLRKNNIFYKLSWNFVYTSVITCITKKQKVVGDSDTSRYTFAPWCADRFFRKNNIFYKLSWNFVYAFVIPCMTKKQKVIGDSNTSRSTFDPWCDDRFSWCDEIFLFFYMTPNSLHTFVITCITKKQKVVGDSDASGWTYLLPGFILFLVFYFHRALFFLDTRGSLL